MGYKHDVSFIQIHAFILDSSPAYYCGRGIVAVRGAETDSFISYSLLFRWSFVVCDCYRKNAIYLYLCKGLLQIIIIKRYQSNIAE